MIAKIAGMRTFEQKYRMQANSIQEIRDGLNEIAFALKNERIGNRPASEGHVMNAAILILMEMDQCERFERLRLAFEQINSMLATEGPDDENVEASGSSEVTGPTSDRPVVIPDRPAKSSNKPKRRKA